MPKDPDVLVELLSTRTEFEAEVIVQKLEDSGVPARSFATSATTLGWMAVDPRPVRVVVRRRDLDRARKALQRARTDSIDIDWSELDPGRREPDAAPSKPSAWLRRWGRAEVGAFLLVLVGVFSFPVFAWWFGATLVACGLMLMGVLAMAPPLRGREAAQRASMRGDAEPPASSDSKRTSD